MTGLIRFEAPELLFELPLSKNAKLVYLFLCCTTHGDRAYFCSRKEIAEYCSMSVKTAANAIKELKEAGHLEKTLEETRRGRVKSNIIRLITLGALLNGRLQ